MTEPSKSLFNSEAANPSSMPELSALLPSGAADAAAAVLMLLTLALLVYGARHYILTFNRLFAKQERGFEGINVATWPNLVVFIAAHNEEAVIANCLEALVNSDYPADRLKLVPVNDRSKDRTKEICDEWAQRYPRLIVPFHRTGGKAGKPAALLDASNLHPDAEVYVIFDADYIPSRGLLKQIVAPFLDPQVGVTMGRVVPCNVERNLLTRILDMERSAGYQGDQQARQNLNAVPQFGGTVGGIRAKALRAVGGFHADVLAEDTDLTYRLLGMGWKVQYVNRAECYEEVPETWSVRVRQLQRWAKGHNQAMARYLLQCVTNPHLSTRERIESLLLLGVYSIAPLTLVGWVLIMVLFIAEPGWYSYASLPLLALVTFGAFGNSAAFFQMAASVRLDGNARRLRLLPLNVVGYAVSAITISRGALNLVLDTVFKRELKWDKTARFRKPEGSTPQLAAASGTSSASPAAAVPAAQNTPR